VDIELLCKEMTYRTSRASGPGGQNVNKVESKVEAVLHIDTATALSEREKVTIKTKLADRISAEGLLSSVNQTARTQQTNKELAEKKLVKIIEKALQPEKKRKIPPVPRSVVEARQEAKKRNAEKKEFRKRPDLLD
jgi:ribosome-associated protein